MTHPKKEPLFYGWVVVAVAALVVLLAAGVRSAPGVFLLPMEKDLGFSKSVISFAVSLGLVMYGLGAPLSGFLMDRFGPKRITLFGLVIIAASLLASAALKQVWQLNLFWGFLSGLGTGIVGSVLGATVANRWFVKRRGLVIGVFGASTSAGQLIFYPLLVAMVVAVGWRESALWIAGGILLCLVPAGLLIRDDPADMGLRPLGAHSGQPVIKTSPEPGVMRRALRSADFWLLAGTFFICGATSNGLIGTHLIPYVVDCGLSVGVAGGVLAVMGAFNFAGTLFSGWLTDRYDPRKLLCIYYGFRGVSLLALPYLDDPVGLSAFGVLFGLDYIATVPPTVALVADTFGRKNVGTVYGWVFCAHQIGAAAAAWMGGVARDALGQYGLAFLVAGVTAVMGGLLSLTIQRTPRKLVTAP